MPEWMERFRNRNRARNWALAGFGYATVAVLGGIGLTHYTQAGMNAVHPQPAAMASAQEATIPPLLVSGAQAMVHGEPGLDPDPNPAPEQAAYRQISN
ncbi:hypothetical protein [Sphingomonas sp.]|uniref:hypothetical protein n=1 Tax=Sphingomonas sp. TaxID=28214 RepID=UPI001B097B52|nr:hypothetical protein [Sphingomonas sp.]MBO9714861.1 hypothetical protein [Sphingomonas sp.]